MKQIKLLGVLMVALTLGLASCGGGNNDGKSGNDSQQSAETCKTHKYGDWTVTKEATCTEDGEQKRTCTVCGYEQTKTIKAAHKYGEWQDVVVATCQQEGSQKRTCTVCGAEDTRTVDKADHNWVSDATKEDVAPTCEETGTNYYVCSVCGEARSETVQANGHTWGDWEITKEATCDLAGSQKHKCSVCGEEQSEEIEALGHDLELVGGETEAPTGEATVRVYKCKRCGITYLGFKADEPSADSLPHLMEGDNGGMRFFGRPIGNAMALTADGTSVNQKNNECVYCSTETGDFFEYIFTLTEDQAATLSTCRLYCDARPANYLSGDFWAYNRSADDWTPGYYIDGAADHVQYNEDNTVMMVKDHAQAVKQDDGSYAEGVELETEVKMGARIEDYRYVLYVDDVIQEFDADTEVPVKGSNNNMQRAEYVLPFTFHLHKGQNKISLRMAGGYRSEFYNFIFRPYVEPTPLDVTTEKIEIRQGETAKIENTALTDLVYTSQNARVASVDENGVVTGVGVGSTTIVVSKEGNYKQVKIPVTVNEKFGVVTFEAEVEGFTSDPADAVVAGNIAQWGTTMGIAEFAKDATYTVKFNAEKAGKFDASFRGYGSIEDLSAAMSVKVNGVDVAVSGSISTNWSAATVKYGQADLVLGENTLSIKALGDTMPKFDSFRFDPVEEESGEETESWPTSCPAVIDTSAWTEGTAAQNSDGKTYTPISSGEKAGVKILASDFSSSSSGSFTDGKLPTSAGQSVAYQVKAAKAGTYEMIMSAKVSASGDSYNFSSRGLVVTVNGSADNANVYGSRLYSDAGLDHDNYNQFVVALVKLTGNEDTITLENPYYRMVFDVTANVIFAQI